MTLKVIDSHFHIWNLKKQELPWLADTDGSITHTYTFDDLKANYDKLDDVDFVGGVYVEVDGADPILEDGIIEKIKREEPKLLACMMRSSVAPDMRVPLFASGVREPLHIPQEPKGRCLQDDFIKGLQIMAKRNLPFESCNRIEELPDAYEAFAKVPEETVILNHLGNVTKREEFTEEYKNVMRKFAELPNLYLKVSGFPTEDKEFIVEVLQFVRGTFDSKKLLYSSNWPVVDMYATFKEHFQILHDTFGDDEDFYMNNALRAYNISL